jgi:hypothetical protein
MALDEAMPHMSRHHESCTINDRNHVMVPNFSETISTVAPLTRASMRMPKPQGPNEILDPWHGEAQR